MIIWHLFICALGLMINGGDPRINPTGLYKNHAKDPSGFYYKKVLIDAIRICLAKKTRTYYQAQNGPFVEIFIDTILYGPKGNKLAGLVIIKKLKEKSSAELSDEFSYDAECFISNLKGTKIVDVKLLNAFSLTSYPSRKKASVRIREIYFTEFNKGEGNVYKYNLNDLGFWEDPNIWVETGTR